MAKWAVLDGPVRSTAHLIVSDRARHESRAVFEPLPRPVVPVRHDYTFLFYKAYYIYIYIYIFAIYNKCTRVLLVSLLHVALSIL
jgi:hypothetical protein